MQTIFAYTFPLFQAHRINDELMAPLKDLVISRFGVPVVPEFPDRTPEDILRAPLNFPADYGLSFVASDTHSMMTFPLVSSGRSPSLESDWLSPLTFVDTERWTRELISQDKVFMDDLAKLFGTTARWLMIRADDTKHTETHLHAPWGVLRNWPRDWRSCRPPEINRWFHTLDGPMFSRGGIA